jgi:hypothetical protein
MRAPLPPFLVALLAMAPAFAGEPGPDAQRFQIAPNDAGAIRIDTTTGAVSHCAPKDGAWTCDPVPSRAAPVASAPSAPSSSDPAAVSSALAGLSARVDELSRRVDQAAGVPVATSIGKPLSAAPARPSLAAVIVGRLVTMVKRLKAPPAG